MHGIAIGGLIGYSLVIVFFLVKEELLPRWRKRRKK